MLTLALHPVATALLTLLFLFVCVLMILTVLIQRPQGGGLSGAFGSGAGSGQTAFGAKTGDALTIATIAIFAIYISTAVGLNYVARPAKAAEEQEESTTENGQDAAGDSTGETASTTLDEIDGDETGGGDTGGTETTGDDDSGDSDPADDATSGDETPDEEVDTPADPGGGG